MAETLRQLIDNGVIPNPVSFVAQIISTIILFLFLKKLVWKPMQEFLEKRRQVIVGELESAKALNEEAQVKKEQIDSELANVKVEATRILENAKRQAELTKENIIEAAKNEASYLKEQAEKEIIKERLHAQAQLKEQAVEIGFAVAEKLIQKNLQNEYNQQMIENLIKEEGIFNE